MFDKFIAKMKILYHRFDIEEFDIKELLKFVFCVFVYSISLLILSYLATLLYLFFLADIGLFIFVLSFLIISSIIYFLLVVKNV